MNFYAKSAVGALALLAVSGCYYYPDRYGYYDAGYGGEYGYGPGYYDAWYDGYYGPYYGGYWGPEGDFYFYDADHRFHRDYEHHFSRQAFQGARPYHTERRTFDRDGGRWR